MLDELMKLFGKVIFSTFFVFSFFSCIEPPDDPVINEKDFILSTENFHPYFAAYIGNGHFSLSSSRLGTSSAESYMIKVYDHGEDDIPRIACLPSWNEINYNNGLKWINDFKPGDSSEFINYSQQLDMYNGLLKTNYNWQVGNRNTNVDILSFISRDNPNLAVIKLELKTDFSDTVKLSFSVGERNKPERKPFAKLTTVDPNPPGKWPAEWYPGFMEVVEAKAKAEAKGGQLQILSQTEGRETKVAIFSEVFYEGDIPENKISSFQSDKSAAVEIKFISEKNKKYIFYKLVSLISELDVDTNMVEKADSICMEAKEKGFNRLLTEHQKEWNNLWTTDIIIEGDDGLQKIVRSMIFYLLGSIDDNTNFSIPPMGLATSGYYGHIFWDADTYMFPPLLFMHPEMANSVVMFRYNTLEAAKENAKKNNYNGAMYPWESDERGEETTPFFAYQNALSENHIVGDVAFAQWQYFLATNDTAWLRNYGLKVITETAEFWVSRVHFNKEKDRYEIGRVVSVSEGLIDINNETYTNSVAKLNLEIAVKVSEILGTEKNPAGRDSVSPRQRWEEISTKMFIPYNEEKEYHPTFEGADEGEGATELWSSVVNLLSYPLQIEMSGNAKKNNLIHAVNSLGESGAGAMMGTNFVPIIAAELEMDSLFNFTINNTLYGYLRPPYNVLAETHTNNSINFITGAGSFLQQVIFGYTGLRLTEEGLIEKYKPMLPDKVTKLTLKNFTVNSKKQDIIVEGNKLKLSPVE
jgi:trehalose/maltose hydrolase-like predicted phosphorylase